MKPTVYITIEGGQVQAVNADTPMNVIIIDFDVEGDDDNLVVLGPDRARVYQPFLGLVTEACTRWLRGAGGRSQ